MKPPIPLRAAKSATRLISRALDANLVSFPPPPEPLSVAWETLGKKPPGCQQVGRDQAKAGGELAFWARLG